MVNFLDLSFRGNATSFLSLRDGELSRSFFSRDRDRLDSLDLDRFFSRDLDRLLSLERFLSRDLDRLRSRDRERLRSLDLDLLRSFDFARLFSIDSERCFSLYFSRDLDDLFDSLTSTFSLLGLNSSLPFFFSASSSSLSSSDSLSSEDLDFLLVSFSSRLLPLPPPPTEELLDRLGLFDVPLFSFSIQRLSLCLYKSCCSSFWATIFSSSLAKCFFFRFKESRSSWSDGRSSSVPLCSDSDSLSLP